MSKRSGRNRCTAWRAPSSRRLAAGDGPVPTTHLVGQRSIDSANGKPTIGSCSDPSSQKLRQDGPTGTRLHLERRPSPIHAATSAQSTSASHVWVRGEMPSVAAKRQTVFSHVPWPSPGPAPTRNAGPRGNQRRMRTRRSSRPPGRRTGSNAAAASLPDTRCANRGTCTRGSAPSKRLQRRPPAPGWTCTCRSCSAFPASCSLRRRDRARCPRRARGSCISWVAAARPCRGIAPVQSRESSQDRAVTMGSARDRMARWSSPQAAKSFGHRAAPRGRGSGGDSSQIP